MKKKFGSRLLSLLLAVTMVVGYLGMLPPTEADAAVVEYATPATEEELDAVPKWFTANTTNASFAKLINGTVYVWGSNAYNVLGITSYTDGSETYPVSEGKVVPTPTAMPAESFGGEKVKLVMLAYCSGVAVTESNRVFVWGYWLNNWLGLGSRLATPVEMNTDSLGDNEIVEMTHTGFTIYIRTADDRWWSAGGSTRAHIQGTTLQAGVITGDDPLRKQFNPLPQAFYDLLGQDENGNPRKIKYITAQYEDCAVVMTEDGYLFGFGADSEGAQTLGKQMVPNPSAPRKTTKTFETEALVYANEIPQFADLKFTYIVGEDQGTAAIDENGDVWVWGNNNNKKFGAPEGETSETTRFIGDHSKLFDHNVFQKKAVRVALTFRNVVILCDDNTVYATGQNLNGMIIANNNNADVTEPTQVFQDLSQDVTLVGLAPTIGGIMAITKSGDMIYLGDNRSGCAGNGSTESAPQGETTIVVSPTLPPSKPLTKNTVSYELEVLENNKTVYYTPEPNGDGTTYKKTSGDSVSTGESCTVDAGANFKLNVYFEDFGKINTFVMPIRFNPDYLEVVNGNGKPYSDTSEVVTPGAIGASVGVEQCFTIQDWNGGQLAIGTKSGTYPKISNADGWISVAGYSADMNPIIKGKIKMFSIAFRAKTTVSGNEIAFDFATNDNKPDSTIGNGYDGACNGIDENGTAYWSIYNASGGGGDSGYFTFNHEPFPAFNSKLVVLTDLGMQLSYGSTNTPVTDTLTSSDSVSPGWKINWSNTSVVYTIDIDAYHRENGVKKPGASFPQVTWSFDTEYVSGANNLDRVWSDYITVVDQQDTYIKFKINSNFTPVDDEAPGYIKVTATSQHYTSVSSMNYICVRSYDAPGVLQIAQKDSSGALTQLGDNEVKIYHYKATPSENRVFWVDFGSYTQNLDVVWSLLDKNGDPIDMSDPAAKVTLIKNNDGSATIEPHYTTTGDDYVTLHVESLYDSAAFDEIKIKVQLYATSLGFTPDTIRMAVMKNGVPSSVDLSKYLGVEPVDVYTTDYSWAIVSEPTRDPSNATKVDASFTPGTAVTYGSLGSGSTAAVFSAFEWATPVATTNGGEGGTAQNEEFVTVRVTENLSGKTADVKIAIMDLNSPIELDQFVATNNLGTQNDTVLVKSGLKLGDKISFYPSYEDALNKSNRWSETTIVNGMFPQFTFYVGDRTKSLMAGNGGFLAVTVTREEETTHEEHTYDPVPVSYSAEPSLVDGYVHLFGKNSGSIADKDIRVDLEGLNFKETVYTNSAGYFKFTKYIAPGKYKMIVSKKNYLTRRMEANSEGVGGINIVVNDDGEFHISTYNQPILLFPGELTNDNAITVADINYYVANWVGQLDGNIVDFDLYDFKEDNIISMTDLELLLMRKDWISGTYPIWNVPQQ